MRSTLIGLLGATLAMATPSHAAEPVTFYAAGSLRAALAEVAEAFTERHGVATQATFAPSGLLRGRIEDGERPHVFASANMAHPRALERQGLGGPVVLFARNELCGLAQPDVEVRTETFLDVLLDENVRLGTSTPEADPSGDYAWDLFRRAEAVRAGSYERLDAKARQLTGGPDSEPAPEGRNPYAWVLTEDRADLFLTYCTNAVLAQQDSPELRIVRIPGNLSVGAAYGLTVLTPDAAAATRFALFILSDAGQRILEDYGFETPTRVGDG